MVLHSQLKSSQACQWVRNQHTLQNCLTSSIVHLATVVAVMPATPGRSLQCCSQHSDRERSGWADRADMKSDWCILSEEIAANKNAKCDTKKGHENILSHSTSLGEDSVEERIWGWEQMLLWGYIIKSWWLSFELTGYIASKAFSTVALGMVGVV